MDHCLFQLDRQVFALPLECVEEAVPLPRLTPVPLAPRELAGIANLRGEVLPVFRIGPLLGLPDSPAEKTSGRVLVLKIDGTLLGLLIDDSRIATEPDTEVEPLSSLLGEPRRIQGISIRPVSPALLLESLFTAFAPLTGMMTAAAGPQTNENPHE
jgi:chemotaxis signal transduction protein